MDMLLWRRNVLPLRERNATRALVLGNIFVDSERLTALCSYSNQGRIQSIYLRFFLSIY